MVSKLDELSNRTWQKDEIHLMHYARRKQLFYGETVEYPQLYQKTISYYHTHFQFIYLFSSPALRISSSEHSQQNPHPDNIIIMIQSDDQAKGGRLILPPVAKTKPPKPFTSIHQILSILHKKKGEYEEQLQKQQPNDEEYSLKYARCETESNHLQRGKGREIAQQQFLARGSIVEQSFYRKTPKRKNKLAAPQIHSTIEPTKKVEITSLTKRNQSAMVAENRYKSLDIRQKQKQPQPQVIKRQPTQKEVINEEQDLQNKESNKKLSEFALPVTIKREERSVRLKQRIKTQVQKQSNATKENSESSYQKANIQKFKENINDLKKGSKTNERLQKTIKSLQTFNPFFRKIQRVIGVCLMRMGKIKNKQANSILYNIDEPYTNFYLILSGEVKITGRYGMHKICETGQTLLEEILEFPQAKHKEIVPVALQRAKVIEESWILEIQRDDLKKLEKELNKFGFRQGLNQMKTLIKRNSIVKNWLRNKFKLLQKH